MRRGKNLLRHPLRFGVWNIEICTRSPYSVINGANSVADDKLGDSRVPRKASVKIETSSLGLFSRASLKVLINSCSVFPMYNVERYILQRAFRILSYVKCKPEFSPYTPCSHLHSLVESAGGIKDTDLGWIYFESRGNIVQLGSHP